MRKSARRTGQQTHLFGYSQVVVARVGSRTRAHAFPRQIIGIPSCADILALVVVAVGKVPQRTHHHALISSHICKVRSVLAGSLAPSGLRVCQSGPQTSFNAVLQGSVSKGQRLERTGLHPHLRVVVSEKHRRGHRAIGH